MAESQSDQEIAAQIWNLMMPGRPFLAMLTTASSDGVPHATWMGAAMAQGPGQIITITSPDSLKVRNIRENPSVEWLFSETSRQELLYLHGSAEIVDDVAELKRCWSEIPNKGQAFFLRYFNTAPGFAVIRTHIASAVLVVPEEFRKVSIPLDALSNQADTT